MQKFTFLRFTSFASIILPAFLLLSAANAIPPPTSAPKNALLPRKGTSTGYDPYMICDQVGPFNNEGLPAAYDEQVYADLFLLCSAAHGAMQNMGCFCSSASSHVHCSEGMAEPDLWRAHYTPTEQITIQHYEALGFPNGAMSFQELCQAGCECMDVHDAAAHDEDSENGALMGIDGRRSANIPSAWYPPSSRPGSTQVEGQDSAQGRTFGVGTLYRLAKPNHDAPTADVDPAPPTTRRPSQALQAADRQQCGQSCKTMSDCPRPRGGQEKGSCACQTVSSQWQPGSGTVAFVAACVFSIASGAKKARSDVDPVPIPVSSPLPSPTPSPLASTSPLPLNLPLPSIPICPCNASYVSVACCSAGPAGLVWESADLKLGELLVQAA